MNQRSVYFTLVIILSVIVGTVYYFFFQKKGTEGDPWKMIPDTPALILQTDNTQSFLSYLSDRNNLWKELSKISQINEVNQQLKEVHQYFKNDSTLIHSIEKGASFMAVYADTNLQSNLLFLFPLNKDISLERVKAYLQRNANNGMGIFFETKDSERFLKIIDGKNNHTWYLAMNQKVLILSRSDSLVLRSLTTVNNFTQSKSFRQIARTSGTIVNASLYLYYPKLILLTVPLINKSYKNQWLKLADFADWTEVDLLIKNHQLLLNGYTNTSKNNILRSFYATTPQNNKAFTVFPFDTRIMLNRWINPLKQIQQNKISQFPSNYQKDIAQFSKLITQTAYISDASIVEEIPHKSWAVIGVSDALSASGTLERLATLSRGNVFKRYDNYTFRRIKIENFIPSLLGSEFSNITESYYTIVNGYVIFASTEDALIRLINFYDTGKTLDLNDNFTTFTNTLASQSNLSVLVQPKGLFGFINQYFNNKVSGFITENRSVLENFPYIGLQWSNSDSLFYTNISISFNTGFKDENLALWKLQLEDNIIGKPSLVKDHQTGKYDIIVFDKSNRMYLINSNGKILWTKRLPDLPVSSIYSVDYYKNRKYQYLFNTESNLFLIDHNGQLVDNYPIRIIPKATNGLTLFDYNNNKDYRILLAQADKKIYDYDIKGNRIKGWDDPKMPDIVTGKIYRLLANHRDYIIITDADNQIKIVSRRGKERIILKSDFKKADNSAYYVNKTNNKGIILTTDTQGQLVYISSRGKLQYTSFGKFTPEHFFLYDDFNGDGIKDFIFIDQKKLTVFNRFAKVIFEHTFSSDITIQPEFFSLGERQKVLGVVVSDENTIYLFDKNGNILVSKGLTGSKPFTVGSLNNDGDINLISASGNTLYNYRLK
ncbi:MAG: hypothetical protein JXR65_03050 [Bacteroidales bacterium]|nr:hypothetical protein [Bacteroidales bacterium]